MQPARHTRADLTLYERLLELETDMTAVQDAVGQLAAKLDQIETLMNAQEADHIAAVNDQIARADNLIARLQGNEDSGHSVPGMTHEVPESPGEDNEGHSVPGLLS